MGRERKIQLLLSSPHLHDEQLFSRELKRYIKLRTRLPVRGFVNNKNFCKIFIDN